MNGMSLTTQILPASGPIENLSAADRDMLSSYGTFETAGPGKTLIQQGKQHGMLIFTIKGLLRAVRLEKGKTEVLGEIHAGEWIGEINLFDPSSAVCSVEVVETSEYWMITRDAFERFINKNHATGSMLLIGLAMTLGKRIRDLTEKRATAVKPKGRPLVSAGLAALASAALVAALGGIGGKTYLEKINADNKARTAGIEQNLAVSQSKEKELQLEITRLQGELEANKAAYDQKIAEVIPAETEEKNVEDQATPAAPQGASGTPAAPKEKVNIAEQNKNATPSPGSKPFGLPYPPEVALTKETVVPLTVAGKVSGSAKIAVGKTFKVVGAESSEVMVTMGASTIRIPKENTNFDEALVAANLEAEKDAKAQAVVQWSAKPTPSATPVPKKTEPLQKSGDSAATDPALSRIDKIMKMVTPMDTLDDLRSMHKSKESAKVAYMRSEAHKWDKAAEAAKECLLNHKVNTASAKWLRDVILTSEMFATERFDGLELKLRELDSGWLNIKTDFEIYGPEGAPANGRSGGF